MQISLLINCPDSGQWFTIDIHSTDLWTWFKRVHNVLRVQTKYEIFFFLRYVCARKWITWLAFTRLSYFHTALDYCVYEWMDVTIVSVTGRQKNLKWVLNKCEGKQSSFRFSLKPKLQNNMSKTFKCFWHLLHEADWLWQSPDFILQHSCLADIYGL